MKHRGNIGQIVFDCLRLEPAARGLVYPVFSKVINEPLHMPCRDLVHAQMAERSVCAGRVFAHPFDAAFLHGLFGVLLEPLRRKDRKLDIAGNRAAVTFLLKAHKRRLQLLLCPLRRPSRFRPPAFRAGDLLPARIVSAGSAQPIAVLPLLSVSHALHRAFLWVILYHKPYLLIEPQMRAIF